MIDRTSRPGPEVAIVDLGCGNLGSVAAAIERAGASTFRTSDADAIRGAPLVVLPGVGAAGYAMTRIRMLGLERVLRELTQPVLGICLGMQLLFDTSEEGDVGCLGIMAGSVTRIEAARGVTVPHMGWSRLSMQGAVPGLVNGEYAWFAHSFACPVGAHTRASVDHGRRFAAIASQDNFTGVQFHPERSGSAGAALLRSFVARQTETLPC